VAGYDCKASIMRGVCPAGGFWAMGRGGGDNFVEEQGLRNP